MDIFNRSLLICLVFLFIDIIWIIRGVKMLVLIVVVEIVILDLIWFFIFKICCFRNLLFIVFVDSVSDWLSGMLVESIKEKVCVKCESCVWFIMFFIIGICRCKWFYWMWLFVVLI